jgi:hypothetical protein
MIVSFYTFFRHLWHWLFAFYAFFWATDCLCFMHVSNGITFAGILFNLILKKCVQVKGKTWRVYVKFCLQLTFVWMWCLSHFWIVSCCHRYSIIPPFPWTLNISWTVPRFGLHYTDCVWCSAPLRVAIIWASAVWMGETAASRNKVGNERKWLSYFIWSRVIL